MTEAEKSTREDNRVKYPDVARFVDQMRAAFGADQIKVVSIKDLPK